MRLKVALILASLAIVPGAAIAIAAHATEIDPATVPTGFFVTHNCVEEVPISIRSGGRRKWRRCTNGAPEVRPNQAFAWHTHPGPIFVNVRSGSLTYQDTAATRAAIERTRGSGFRRSRLRPRAPRDRWTCGRRHLLNRDLPAWIRDRPDPGVGPEGLFVARQRRRRRREGAARAAPSRCAVG